MIRKVVKVVVVYFIIQSSVVAGSFKPYAGEFAYLGTGPRATALGGAFTALSNDVTSSYWNPAGLIEAKGLQAIFMHSKQFISSIQNNYLAISTPFEDNSALGFSIYYLTVINIPNSLNAKNEITNQVVYSDVSFFNTGDYVFTGSYAKKYDENINWGVNVKLIYRDYELETATGFGFDAGLKYITGNLKFGAIIRDLTGTVIAWSNNTTEYILPSVKLGAAYTYYLNEYNLMFTPTMDLNILNENRDYSAQFNLSSVSGDLMAGLEVSYDEIISLRMGIDDIGRFTTGIGISIPRVNIDYSFTSYENELGNIHRISIHTFFNDVFKE